MHITPARTTLHVALIAAALGTSMQAMSATAYDESVQGDLSDNRLAPTVIGTFVLGDNDVLGASGVTAGGNAYRDYGTFVVPANAQLTAIHVLPVTAPSDGGDEGLMFFGLQAGSQITVNPNSGIPDPGKPNLIGWNHFAADTATLSLVGYGTVSPLPLAAGPYSFWIQDFDDGAAPYGLRFTIMTTAVPEPGSYAMMGLGLAAIGGVVARRRNVRR